MAEIEVTGQSIWLMIDPAAGTNYDTLICLTTKSLNRTTETIESSSQCGTSSGPGKKAADVSFEGVQMVDLDSGHMSGADLHDLWDDQTKFTWKLTKAIPIADDITYSGMGFITSLSDTYGEGNATFSGSFSVSGNLTKVVEES